MDYPNLKKRFFVSKILFALVAIGFVVLVYLHSFAQLIGNSFLLRFLGIMLLCESGAKLVLFPYHKDERTLHTGRIIRVLVAIYLILHLPW